MFNSLLLHISCFVLIRTHFPTMSLQFFLSFISFFRELSTYTSDKGFLFIFFRSISPDDQLLLSLLVFDSFFDHFRALCSRFFSYFSRSPVSVSCLSCFLVCATIPATCSIPSLTSGIQFLQHRCWYPSRRFLSSFLLKEIIRRIIFLYYSVNRVIVPRVPRLHIVVHISFIRFPPWHKNVKLRLLFPPFPRDLAIQFFHNSAAQHLLESALVVTSSLPAWRFVHLTKLLVVVRVCT